MNIRSRSLLVLSGGLLLLVSVAVSLRVETKDNYSEKPENTDQVQAKNTEEIKTQEAYSTGSGICEFNPSWLSSPSLPQEVGNDSGNPSNCDFQQFMWQSFIYLVTPSNANNQLLNFETWMPYYGIFVEEGRQPAAWGSTPAPEFCEVTAQDGYVYSDLTLQAGSRQPLIDQQGEPVFYGVAVNREAYDFITECDLYKAQCGLTLAPDLLPNATQAVVNIPENYPHLAFPDGAVELKTSWKILTQAEQNSGRFYTRNGVVKAEKAPGQTDFEPSCKEQVLGLVGMHIVSKIPNNPEFVWGTFEQVNNAPDCTDLNDSHAGGDWTFISQKCAADIDSCVTNEYIDASTPAEVCRMHPLGDPIQGVWPDGLTCDSVPTPDYICNPAVQQNVIEPNNRNLKAINASAAKVLSGNASYRLWANYTLVGNLWTKFGTLPPDLQVQEGSLSAANTTMETFVQNGEANKTNPNNCFSCHNQDGRTQDNQPVTLPQAGLSHIFNLLQPNTTGCNNGTALPASCQSYFEP